MQRDALIAILAGGSIAISLGLQYAGDVSAASASIPLFVTLLVGGGYLLIELARTLRRGEWGADLLAGLSIITSVLTGEYLVGAIIVLLFGYALRVRALGSPAMTRGGERP